MADEAGTRLRCFAAGIDAADGVSTALEALDDFDRHAREPAGFRHDAPKIANSDRTLYWAGVSRLAQAADAVADCDGGPATAWVGAWREYEGPLRTFPEDPAVRRDNYYHLVNLLLRMREGADKVLPFRGLPV